MLWAFFCNMRKAIRLACLCLLSTSLLRAQATHDQIILQTLQTAGNVDRISLNVPGLTPHELKQQLDLYITYDPMNPGAAVNYSVAGGHPLVLSFAPKYGAFVKLVFRDGAAHPGAKLSITAVHLADSPGNAADATGGAGSDALGSRPWMNPNMPLDQRVESLLAAMTPADKMELLREGWGIPGIPRLGIPAMKKVEAIHGFSYGSGATIFPQSIAMGATWDKALIEKVAMAIGDETVSAHAVQAWSPVLDVAQDPRWGRCEETYGEDPVLVSEIGGAWIKGYQSRGLIVTPKHFAVHGAVMGGRDSWL